MTLLWILVASLAGGLLSVGLAATVLTIKPAILDRLLPRLVSFSTGSLLAAALLGMIPHAAQTLSISQIAWALLVGLLAFFVLEKLLVWRHCHDQDCDVHAASGPLLLLGDAFHNFVDGVAIAAAFLSSPAIGVAVAVSTIAHEVPQELGEFVIYLRSGYSRARALLLNAITSLASVVGALLGYFFLSAMQSAGPWLLAFAAAGFLYVALADLVPAQRARMSFRYMLLDVHLVAAGIALIVLVAHAH